MAHVDSSSLTMAGGNEDENITNSIDVQPHLVKVQKKTN
jgi:hypothetical protein